MHLIAYIDGLIYIFHIKFFEIFIYLSENSKTEHTLLSPCSILKRRADLGAMEFDSETLGYPRQQPD